MGPQKGRSLFNPHIGYAMPLPNRGQNTQCTLSLYLFMGVQPLLFKAETLNLIEVEASLKWDDIVCGYPCHRAVRGVACRVESQSSLPRHHLDLLLVWLELPVQS